MVIAFGVGFLIVNDILTDVAYALFQPSVKTTVPVGGIAIGVQTVNAFDPAMYVGAQVVVGLTNGNAEVVTITAINPGVSFSATFTTVHGTGEPIRGATFPIRQTTDPLFTQAEMLQYISTAMNDFLVDCPIVYTVTSSIQVQPSQQNTALPNDCMYPVRVAYEAAAGPYPLRESSQSNLDSMNPLWNQTSGNAPRNYFRDKVPFQSIGIWPRPGNTTSLEVIYAQRQTVSEMGLADGFLVPDPFLIYVLYKTLEYAYSKDGEARNPGLAKWCQGRYEFGVKVSKMFVDSIMDSGLEMAQ